MKARARMSSVSATASAPETTTRPIAHAGRQATAFTVLAAVSFSHLLNDTIQSLLPAIYPLLKQSFSLTFSQIGLMTLALMLTASLLQPVVGFLTDRRPAPYALVVGMGFTLVGLLLLSVASTYPLLLLAAALVGIGSSVFHPESSRVARMASGGQHGLAQSLFQVGGNVGSSLGPLVAAFLVAPYGQSSLAWCSLVAVAGMFFAFRIGRWYRRSRRTRQAAARQTWRGGRRRRPGESPGRCDSRRADLLEVLLHGEPEQLLHLLSDREVPRLGAERPDLSLRLSRRGGRRHHPRRADRRSHRRRSRSSGDRSSACCPSRCCCRTRICSGPPSCRW